ncbi:deaminase [Gluconobacter cerinus]|uniref:deaminase n=1 Tax=Gluconobacter cerinus TaxID=38307 RepID=UPI001B8C02E1|nr:deaminase [Gluconobacter cerinus]MBS0995912.1 hypothetical protein [Gluconobacter cerinus]
MKFNSLTDADTFYLKKAFSERSNSDDIKAIVSPQSAVGAVIANASGELSRSANVVPESVKRNKNSIVSYENRYFIVEHAERAALFKAYNLGLDLKDATLYCTRFPCSDCARAIVWSPIRRLVLPSGFSGEKNWLNSQRAALKMLRDAGVKIRYLKFNQ